MSQTAKALKYKGCPVYNSGYITNASDRSEAFWVCVIDESSGLRPIIGDAKVLHQIFFQKHQKGQSAVTPYSHAQSLS